MPSDRDSALPTRDRTVTKTTGPSVRPRRAHAEPDRSMHLTDEKGTIHRVEQSSATGARSKPAAPRLDGAVNSAMELISETAHDLLSPLASIETTMQLMRDGQFGDVNNTQQECLNAAIGQCDYLTVLIEEMQNAHRVHTGDQRTKSRAVTRGEIVSMVSDATAAVLASARIGLLFDADDSKGLALYVDPKIVCRLLVNLVINAKRATKEGGTILVKVTDDMQRGVAHWSVIDCGRGMSRERLEQLSQAGSVHSDNGGSGLGIRIAAQLASQLYSQLHIRSRQGSGTDVMFETPLAGAQNLVNVFARYRCELASTPVRPNRREETTVSKGGFEEGSDLCSKRSLRQRVHDQQNTTVESTWNEARISTPNRGPRHATRIAVGTLTADPRVPAPQIELMNHVLQEQVTRFEMVCHVGRRVWVWALDADHRHVGPRLDRIRQACSLASIDTSSFQWGEPTITAVRERTLQRFLGEHVTMQSLSQAARQGEGGMDQDAVRLGTKPIQSTDVAATRLDDELRRLSYHLGRQAQGIRSQSARQKPRS